MTSYLDLDLKVTLLEKVTLLDQKSIRYIQVSVLRTPDDRATSPEETEFPGDLYQRSSWLEQRRLTGGELTELGKTLGQLLLPQAARSLVKETQARCVGDQRLRIRLRFGSPELANIPWEYAHWSMPGTSVNYKGLNQFLALDNSISLVRYETDSPPESYDPISHDKLRMVALFANPTGYPQLDLIAEQENLEKIVSRFPDLQLRVFPAATRETLFEALADEAQIFHFAGHGEWRRTSDGSDEGSLVLTTSSGDADLYSASKLAVLLRNKGVRLAVLGACHAGRINDENPWAGVASALARAGIPAVVGMQYTIEDPNMREFSRQFYQRLMDNQPIDDAVTWGRHAIMSDDNRDWGVPVLYMRASDGVLFPKSSTTTDPRSEPVAHGSQEPDTTPPGPQPRPDPGIDAGPVLDAPLYGRAAELKLYKSVLVDPKCRLVTLVGMAGIGKRRLAAALKEAVKGKFEHVFWFNLKYEPSFDEFMQRLLPKLFEHLELDPPTSVDQQIKRLIKYLDHYRCLLVFDNFEETADRGEPGRYRTGYAGYGQLIRSIGEYRHQSCLLLISWETPPEVRDLEYRTQRAAVRRPNALGGLPPEAAYELLVHKGVPDHRPGLERIMELCSGNPTALSHAGSQIVDVYGGDVEAFLANEGPISSAYRALLDGRFERLSDLEQSMLYWLAIEREPVSLETLSANLQPSGHPDDLKIARDSLVNRSFIELSNQQHQEPTTGNGDQAVARTWRLTTFMMAYLTDRLVHEVGKEIKILGLPGQGPLKLFHSHALIKAQAKEYVRRLQVEAILKPIAEFAKEAFLTPEDTDRRIRTFLDDLRTQQPPRRYDYAAGNTLNLLSQLNLLWKDKRGAISDLDFAGLTIQQAYLRDVELHDVAFTNAYIADTVFAEAFGRIFAVVFDPKGERLSAGADNGEVYLWKATERRLALDHVYTWHSDLVRSIAFRLDPHSLASGSTDASVRLLFFNRNRIEKHPNGAHHQAAIRSVAFSPTDNLLAWGAADDTVVLWDLDKARRRRILRGHKGWVRSVAFSPDGRTLASGSADTTVRLWDVATGEPRRPLTAHKLPVRAVAFSPDGRLLASGSADKTVRLWDPATGQEIRVLHKDQDGHTDRVRSVAFSPNGEKLVSGGDDRRVIVWNVKTGEPLRVMPEHTNRIWSVAFSPDGSLVASGSDDQTVRLWNVESGLCEQLWRGHNNRIWSLAFSPQGDRLVAGCGYGTAHVWNISTGKLEGPPLEHDGHTPETIEPDGRIRTVTFAPHGDRLATGSEDGTIKFWKTDSWAYENTLEAHNSWVRTVAFSPDGRVLASGSDDESVILWDVASGLILHKLRGPTAGWVRAVAFSPDGRLIAAAGNGIVRLWDSRTGTFDGTLQPSLRGKPHQRVRIPRFPSKHHPGRTRSVVFSGDGKRIAAAGDDGRILMWDVDTREELSPAASHMGRVRSLVFNPAKHHMLASAGDDGQIWLWDFAAEAQPSPLPGPTRQVRALAFSPDGELLASGGPDEVIRLWHVSSRTFLKELESPRMYRGMDITGVYNISDLQKQVLRQLGARDASEGSTA